MHQHNSVVTPMQKLSIVNQLCFYLMLWVYLQFVALTVYNINTVYELCTRAKYYYTYTTVKYQWNDYIVIQ